MSSSVVTDEIASKKTACGGADGIGQLDMLTVRAYNCLFWAGLCQISDVERISDAELLRVKNLGVTTVENIREAIAYYREQHPLRGESMPLSATDKLELEKIENMFTYHPPKGDQADRYTKLRGVAKEFAHLIVELCPDSPERVQALTGLQATVLFANASIALHDPDTVH